MSAPAFALALAAVLMLPATRASAELFPSATAGCYVGAEIPAGVATSRKLAVPVTTVRLERGYPQLALEDEQAPSADGGRLINLRVIVTFADGGKAGAPKRYANGLYGVMRCSADLCDAGNYEVERQADGAVLLRMTGGLNVGGGTGNASRRLPDGHVYRLVASPMGACR
jgi:hypothetical protein